MTSAGSGADRPTAAPGPTGLLAELLPHTALAAMVVLVIVAAARPIYTDDVWWHLKLGQIFASDGLWLDQDPLLFEAAGPPPPAAWLFDLGLSSLLQRCGFSALRVAHAVSILGILAFVWWLLLGASRSRSVASLGTGLFVALSTYRLFQLRPHLFTILATLILYWLLVAESKAPSYRRVALATILCGLWANIHPGFLLGPILLAAALAGAVIAAAVAPPETAHASRVRAARLGTALVALLLATLASPSSSSAYAAILGAGDAPDLALVSDEWAPTALFRLPLPDIPPSPLAWALVWLLLLCFPLIAWRGARSYRHPQVSDPRVDPALLTMASACLVGAVTAVRFLWLGIFPLLLGASVLRRARGATDSPVFRRCSAAVAPLLLVAFVSLGDWTLVSNGIPGRWASYARPYATRKYYAHAVWFLRDSGVSGNLFSDYFMGGFLGFWLAPEIRVFVNGTLNVPNRTMASYRAIRQHRGLGPETPFLELLDRHQVDFFLGLGLPSKQNPNRPWRYTTAYLERADGWLLVFRNLRSAVYIRDDSRNRENIRLITHYYGRQGVPFDPSRGFDVDRVLREAPAWALEHGIVTRDFPELVKARFGLGHGASSRLSDRLPSIYAALGLYDEAVKLDRRALEIDPAQPTVRRRLVWSLLQLGQGAAALEAAEPLEGVPGDPLGAHMASAARHYASLPDEEERDALVALLPLFTRREGHRLLQGYVNPEPRRPE